MSFSVFVFHVSSPRTREQLLAQAQSYYEEIDEPGEVPTEDLFPIIEGSPKIDQFLRDLNDRYPTAEEVARMAEADRWQCPWAGSMEVTAGTIDIPMDASTPDEANNLVVTLAKKHRLVCVGPVDHDLIYVPPELLIGPPPKSKRWWQVWR